MSDNAASFIDTNVLLYAISTDQRKKRIILDLLKSNAYISINVLNEYTNKNPFLS